VSAGLSSCRRARRSSRLDGGGLQWPCPHEEHPGTPILHVDTFALGPQASLHAVEYRGTSEEVTPEYPLTLITGRSLYQFNAGTMTGRTANAALRSTDVLDISPVDADRLGLDDGQVVCVTSRYGTATLPLCVSAALNPGQLFATFQTPGIFLNALTGPSRDHTTGTPEYKVTAVRVESMVPR
jgi:formate dehydrogenase major subunit